MTGADGNVSSIPMTSAFNAPDWSTILAPQDDGAASHLLGAAMAPVTLKATNGDDVDLSARGGVTVLYAYPRTGSPHAPSVEGWDMIPGARGCTPQSCGFRDHFAELRTLGVDQVFGLSTQDTAYQSEAADRLHLPFPLLSDDGLALTHAMDLPTLQAGGMTLLKRFTLVIRDGVVEKAFYPVFPPDRNAADVIAWLEGEASRGTS